MWRATCVCLHTPSIAKEFSFQQAKKCISEQKMTTVGSRLRTVKNSNFCLLANRRAVPVELMKTKMLDAAGFLVKSKDKTSILSEDQHFLYSHRVPNER